MTTLPFTKMQGLGNDFVVLDGPLTLDSSQVAALCDRRRGVGADGVLVVTGGDTVRMDYWNADGTPAEMCGNGLRCIARYALDKGLVESREFVVETAEGPRRVRVGESDIEVEMGAPELTGHESIDGAEFHLVDVGNPHAVTLVDDPGSTSVRDIGPRVERDERFDNGTNVEFATVREGRVTMRVWERGVGETLACGTGMVAAALVAAEREGLDGHIRVDVPGGSGWVEFRDGVAWLTGPAEYSFSGVVDQG